MINKKYRKLRRRRRRQEAEGVGWKIAGVDGAVLPNTNRCSRIGPTGPGRANSKPL